MRWTVKSATGPTVLASVDADRMVRKSSLLTLFYRRTSNRWFRRWELVASIDTPFHAAILPALDDREFLKSAGIDLEAR